MIPIIGNDWDEILQEEYTKEYWGKMMYYLNNTDEQIYPPREQWFRALEMTSYADTYVVILGQDPYHGRGQAHGLAFSVPVGVPIPPSLNNIYRELVTDYYGFIPDHGCLEHWAKEGVLLLNSTLTVAAGRPGSHRKIGWDQFTDAILRALDKKHNIVFMLWGRDARIKGAFLDRQRNLILEAAHPSPLAGGRFEGCKHFTKCNRFLYECSDIPGIRWQIPYAKDLDKVEYRRKEE